MTFGLDNCLMLSAVIRFTNFREVDASYAESYSFIDRFRFGYQIRHTADSLQ